LLLFSRFTWIHDVGSSINHGVTLLSKNTNANAIGKACPHPVKKGRKALDEANGLFSVR
jgi:hypothetical protein